MLVELKNGETLNGHLVNCDTWMNLTLKEVVQTSPVRFYIPSTPYAVATFLLAEPSRADQRGSCDRPHNNRKATSLYGYQKPTSKETTYVATTPRENKRQKKKKEGIH